MMSIPQNFNFILVSADYPMDRLFAKFLKFKPSAINAFLPKMVEFVNTNAFQSTEEDISFVKFVMGKVQKNKEIFHFPPEASSVVQVGDNDFEIF